MNIKSIVVPAVLAVVLALAGWGFWTLGHTEQRLADAHIRAAVLGLTGDRVLGALRTGGTIGPEASVLKLGLSTLITRMTMCLEASHCSTVMPTTVPAPTPNAPPTIAHGLCCISTIALEIARIQMPDSMIPRHIATTRGPRMV